MSADASKRLSLGFVGLGNMGSQMARNLALYAEKNGLPPVRIWNRTRSKIEYLIQEAPCEIVSSIEEVAEKCDVVHTCLANDEVALSVYRQFFSTKSAGTIFADHSTLYHTTAASLQEDAARAGMHYLSCPVFGPPAAAKSAQLLVVVSGDHASREVIKQYIVPTIGRGFLEVGEDASKGALMKLLGNNCILGTIELLSESFTLAEKTGLDTSLFYEFIRTSPICRSVLL
jgi:3-hydroxyisobutyrate dehydrogenase-like beta-hydroxyacid dehydrogenase